MGTQIAWLLPAALVATAALAWLTARRPRTDALRASAIVWGGWLVVTALVLSFASGIIHPYYTVALAPAIAALVGIGVVELWRARGTDLARWALATLVAGTAVCAYVLLGRASWHPELRWIVILAGALATAAVLAGSRVKALVVAPLIVSTLLVAPTAYALQTAASPHTGALPTAGPSASGGFGGGGGGRAGGGLRGGAGGFAAGGNAAQGGNAAPGGAGRGAGGRGGMGGLGGDTTVSSALQSALQANAGDYTWTAATTSDNEAASLELATGTSVMSLGGYNGTDNAITLAQFQKLVADGQVHYYVADGQGFIGSTAANTSTAYAIQQWVSTTFAAQTIGTSTVYDLTSTG
jgi:4-amino-4-deoxy-L-arabinose transferase-like glycosyltransferase